MNPETKSSAIYMAVYLKTVLTCCILMQVVVNCQAQNWKLSKSNHEIKVYTGREPNSKYDIIKVEALLDGNLDKLIAILKNVENNKNWVYKTKLAYRLAGNLSNDLVYYAETSLPWPLSNRDMVIKMQFIIDSINNKLHVVAKGMPDAVELKKGLVRIRKFDGLWEVSQETDKKISIRYLLKLDPGGSIPASVSNMFVSNGPFETFNNLSRLLKN